ncbi:SIR2 family protein [Paenarthrobacter sp. NPDC090522]|uniref:SIR2 family protein n=1 Tax=Paenarthrobacter sp. NPDC090522 TaxID=3364383 RepID=UPI00382885A9
MIENFKASLYAADHRLFRSDIDAEDPLWIERINAYFNGARGFPLMGDPKEYEAAFTRMYPSAADRRRYISTAVELGSPSYGQQVLGALLATGQTPLAFTTNFDSLIEQSAMRANDILDIGQRLPLRVAALTNSDIARRCLEQGDWPLLVKLHGDYQSDSIKNTESELRAQDETLGHVLTESMRRFGLVVAGYSGRDESVMDALEQVLETPTPYPNGLFWVRRSSTRLLPRVEKFLESAGEAGVETYVVASETFDELLGEIARHKDFPSALSRKIVELLPTQQVQDVQLPVLENGQFPVLRFNALPVVELPARVITAQTSIENKDLRNALKIAGARVDAVSNGQEVFALGSDTDLRNVVDRGASLVFGSRVADPGKDTVVHGLLLRSLVRALANGRPVRPSFRDRGHLLYLTDPSNVRNENTRGQLTMALEPFKKVYGPDLYGRLTRYGNRQYAEGVRLRLEPRLGRWWLLFEPFTWVERDPDRRRPDPVSPWIRERWFKRRNKDWAQMVGVWAAFLAPEELTSMTAWPGDESTRFVISKTTAWSVPGQSGLS